MRRRTAVSRRHLDVGRRRRRRDEPLRAGGPLGEDAFVDNPGMEVDVGVQRRAAALDGGHRAGAPHQTAGARPAPLEGEHRAHEHRQHGAAEAMIVGERIAAAAKPSPHIVGRPLAHQCWIRWRAGVPQAMDAIGGQSGLAAKDDVTPSDRTLSVARRSAALRPCTRYLPPAERHTARPHSPRVGAQAFTPG